MANLPVNAFIALGILSTTGLATSQAAIVDQKDSAEFEYAYEGTAVTITPIAGGQTVNGFGNTGYTGTVLTVDIPDTSFNSDGNILTHQTSLSYGGAFESTTWNSVADQAGGWTWEMRFQVTGQVGAWAGLLRLGPAGNTTAETAHEIFTISSTGINGLSGSLALSIDLASSFNTLRIAQAAGSSAFNVWVNEQLEGTFTLGADGVGEGFLGGVTPWWGDGSGSGGGTVLIDHIRFTGEGGFAPIPEPSSLAVISLAALAGMRNRRR